MGQTRPKGGRLTTASRRRCITAILQPRREEANMMTVATTRTRARPAGSKSRGPGAATTRGGDTMTNRIHVTAASIAAAVAALAVVAPARAGGDKVAFPENHAAGVLFTTVDRPDNKQFREFYTSTEALDAAKKGEPLPSGTVLTMIQYAAKLDAQGNPEKDANGRFIKGNLIGYTVMEKRTGWGAEYPDNVRNGEWEYQAFKADKTPNAAANLTACFNCHKPLDKQDFVFLYDKLKAAAK
jgi:Cytochrome P460